MMNSWRLVVVRGPICGSLEETTYWAIVRKEGIYSYIDLPVFPVDKFWLGFIWAIASSLQVACRAVQAQALVPRQACTGRISLHGGFLECGYL